MKDTKKERERALELLEESFQPVAQVVLETLFNNCRTVEEVGEQLLEAAELLSYIIETLKEEEEGGSY